MEGGVLENIVGIEKRENEEEESEKEEVKGRGGSCVERGGMEWKV